MASSSAEPPRQESEETGRSLRTRRQNRGDSGDGPINDATSSRLEDRVRSLFLDDFNPEESSRELRKQTRKTTSTAATKNSVLDERGRYRGSGVNACDCLDNTCAGCHFPCPACGSGKCGTTCRVNRKWVIHSIVHDGKDLVISNPNLRGSAR